MHLHIILVMTYLASFTPGLFYGVCYKCDLRIQQVGRLKAIRTKMGYHVQLVA